MQISKNLKDNINRNYELLIRELSRNQFMNSRYNHRRQNIRGLAEFHSAALEHPNEAYDVLTRKRGSRRILTRAQKDIERAYARNSNFTLDKLTCGTIDDVNGIITGNKGFRNRDVSLGLKFTPPGHERVQAFMNALLLRLKEYGQDPNVHPVEIAIEAHFGIATIQPYDDGNKRTARIMEGTILELKGYPVSVVPIGERELYLTLLGEAGFQAADKENRALPKNWNTTFADYIASKVNCSLERMLGRKY